jgi:hypothetical protein
MPIPNAAAAHVPPDKRTAYLLNESHPVGGNKAKWLSGLGYAPTALEKALSTQVQNSDDFTETVSPLASRMSCRVQ